MAGPSLTGEPGFTLIELLFVVAIGAMVSTIAIPATGELLEVRRTEMAARYLAARLAEARLGAVKRSASIALRFDAVARDYTFTAYADGNGNGVRSAEIASAVDRALGPPERLRDKFPDVVFGLAGGYPDADGTSGTGEDGVRMGIARIATMSPDGSATPGTLYLRGRRSQFAVRVLGTTGRVRVLQYRPSSATWVAR